jgi:hypothetical protein
MVARDWSADGSSEFPNVDNFRGTPGAPVSDAMLADLLAQYAAGILADGQAAKIAQAIRALDTAQARATTRWYECLTRNSRKSAFRSRHRPSPPPDHPRQCTVLGGRVGERAGADFPKRSFGSDTARFASNHAINALLVESAVN